MTPASAETAASATPARAGQPGAGLTAGSLFSGIGGIDVAFAAAGFDIRFQVEIDPFCRKVLAKHAPNYWPNAAQYVDVRSVGRAELGTVDVLFGGFPCQDISIAGNGAGITGKRSGLWSEFRRIIGDVRPRVVFIENVPAITGRGGTTVIAHLAALGYDARWGIVGAADAGAPHQRDRFWCVAYAQGGQQGRASQSRVREWAAGQQDRRGVRSGLGNGGSSHVAYARRIGYDEPAAAQEYRHPENGDGPARQQTGQHEQSAPIADRQAVGDADRFGLAPVPAIAEVQAVHTDDYGSATGRWPSQSRFRRNADGLSHWLDRPHWPAGSGQPQHRNEPPRQVSGKQQDWSARIHALGNAVVPQVVYPFAVEIARMLFADAAPEAG